MQILRSVAAWIFFFRPNADFLVSANPFFLSLFESSGIARKIPYVNNFEAIKPELKKREKLDALIFGKKERF